MSIQDFRFYTLSLLMCQVWVIQKSQNTLKENRLILIRPKENARSDEAGDQVSEAGVLMVFGADVAAVGGVEDRERVLGFVVAEMAQGREEQVGLLKAVFHIVISRYEHHRRVLLFKADVVQRRGVIRDQSAAVEVSFL